MWGQVLSESFEDISQLPARGWVQANTSSPVGPVSWFQGNPEVMPPRTAPGYIAANFWCAGDASGADAGRSAWLIMPPLLIANGDAVTFWTCCAGGIHADRLQIRASANGSSTDVGQDPDSVGDFNLLLLDLNPQMNCRDYPIEWTRCVATLSGLPPGRALGRIAFRYYLPAQAQAPGNYIGIDNVQVDSGPPPRCYPNCDGSTTAPLLNISDFTCFLHHFSWGDPYANCDGSTVSPVLNVNDFVCFIQRYSEGCL